MSSVSAPRCRHIKVNGTQCGSPALRSKTFCFYHQQDRPIAVECYYKEEYPLGEIELHLFEDAHSIQSVIRQVIQMVLQKRLEQKTASLILYALQIASSNLKRMEKEKPQPEQVVVDIEVEEKSEKPIASTGETIQACAEFPVDARVERTLLSARSNHDRGRRKPTLSVSEVRDHRNMSVSEEGIRSVV